MNRLLQEYRAPQGHIDMSEQEQIPEPRAWQSAASDEQEQASQFYYKAARKDGKVGPKEEPPLNYDEPMIEGQSLPEYQSGYAARRNVPYTILPMDGATRGNTNSARQQWQQQQFRSGQDGDAYESRYRANSANNQAQWVPPWAKPQPRQRGSMRVIALIILGLLLIGPLLHLLSVAFLVIGIVFASMVFFLLIAAFVLLLMFIRGITGRPGRRAFMSPFWMGYRPRRRGPWWW